MLKAVIFDMDGVISDTQVLHAAVEEQMLGEYGVAMAAEDITRQFAGRTMRDIYELVFASHPGPKPTVDEFVQTKRARILEHARGRVRAIPGVREFITELQAAGIPRAVASASQIPFIQLVLGELGLEHAFDVTASSTEVQRGKPDPAVFLLAAERLGIAPEHCIVIEDGISGMVGARRAGMPCVGLVPVKDPTTYPADLLIQSFSELSLDVLHRIL